MCLFCDIIDKKIPSTPVYEDENVYCFNDINPVAPVHVLVVPKKHFEDILDIASSADADKVLGDVSRAISKVAEINNLGEGFRVINNCREFGGQTVKHIHFHVIGGLKLTEKMI